MRKFTLKATLLLSILIGFGNVLTAQEHPQKEPMEQGIYEPTWESLSKYEVPEWFQDAKFGLWAHWGPQCQPESGDWYARHMYYSGHWQYNVHVQKYGHPSEFGFKDVINIWKAEKWDPDSLIRFYKSVGAKYFMTLANHHDNFDLWDSKYQVWNSVNMGPKKDIVGGWAEACKKYGLPLGVSVHASHTWLWMEGAQDFDGKLTKEDGIGKWWEGYDPQELYEQNHPRSVNSHDVGTIHSQWNWGNGAAQPTEAYKTKVYNRTIDLINKYHPDMIYYDDTAVPFYPISNEGLEMTAHLYNKSLKDNNGDMRAVVMGKILNEEQKECMLWDVERGVPDRPQQKYWQTCTCLGQWHYDRGVYDRNEYKSAATVIKMLIDVVSKNGNLLMSVPVRGDGSIDEKEVAILKDIKAWMDINGESIFGTRPWTVFGEGPNAESSNPLNNQGFNEGVNYVAEDIRYVKKGDVVYVTALGWSANNVMMLKNLSSVSPYYDSKISKVELLGYGEVSYVCDKDGLMVKLPTERPNPIAPVLKVYFGGTATLTDLHQLQEVVVTDLDLAKSNVGNNTGQYEAEYVNVLDGAYQDSKVDEGASADEIGAAYLQLKKAYADFLLYGANKCVVLKGDEQAEDVTKDYLVEANNFSRSDEGVVSTSRFGLLGEPWVVTSNIINQDNFTTGGFDSYNSSKCIGVQKWYNTDPAIENGKIYQVTTLPAGSYNFSLSVHEQYGLTADEILFCVAKGKVLPDMADVKTEALAYHDMVTSKTGGLSKCCYFTLEEETEVCLGWSVSIAAAAKEKSIRVSRIRLYKDNEHVSADYLKNYDRIQRKDISYPRFGVPQYWTVENFNVPQSNGDGTKLGIDKYPGYNTLMLGVWNDRASAVGDLSKARIYKKVTLPAGTYYFGASYQALYKIGHGFIFMSETLPETNSAEACDAYALLADASLNGNTYGIKFTLDKETEVYLGWMADLTEGDATQEFRASEISLLKYKEAEGGGDKIETVKAVPDFKTSAEYYTIAGTRLDKEPSQGFFIMRQNGNTFKMYNR
ncbi:MAG: alpha-L-fucosidase [Paraprevotella sp.]|nr:alpha-L-fucosidase [Paraprevotella sp.]